MIQIHLELNTPCGLSVTQDKSIALSLTLALSCPSLFPSISLTMNEPQTLLLIHRAAIPASAHGSPKVLCRLLVCSTSWLVENSERDGIYLKTCPSSWFWKKFLAGSDLYPQKLGPSLTLLMCLQRDASGDRAWDLPSLSMNPHCTWKLMNS